MGEFVRPPLLKAGDLIRVVAPAGPFDRTLFFRGLSFLKQHFRVSFESSCQERSGYLAGSVERRLGELNRALRCAETRAIVAARGGVGSGELAANADFAALRRDPKWLVGFSDITALHCEAQRYGIESLHAANVTGLGVGDARGRAAWVSALQSAAAPVTVVQTLVPGFARGPLIGGNLSLVEACAAQGRWRSRAGAILLLEEIAERPYRIDRLMTTLANGGFLDELGAIVLGHLTQCRAGRDGVTALAVFKKHAIAHGLPCVSGVPSGHDFPNQPCRLGATHELRAEEHGGTLAMCQ